VFGSNVLEFEICIGIADKLSAMPGMQMVTAKIIPFAYVSMSAGYSIVFTNLKFSDPYLNNQPRRHSLG